MFCKNCGREIDQSTLEKMMSPSGESVQCPDCGQALDTAEFCGGFWGLVASGEAMRAGNGAASEGGSGTKRGSGKSGNVKKGFARAGQRGAGDARGRSARIPGITGADRLLARMILENAGAEYAESGSGEKSFSGSAAGRNTLSGGATEGKGSSAAGSGEKSFSGSAAGRNALFGGATEGKDSSGRGSGVESGRKSEGFKFGKNGRVLGPAGAMLVAAAVLVGFLFGRFVPAGRGAAGGSESALTSATMAGAGQDSLLSAGDDNAGGQSEDEGKIPAADGSAGEKNGAEVLSAEGTDSGTGSIAPEGGTEGSLSSDSTAYAAGAEIGKYNMIRRSMTDVNGTQVENAVLYFGTKDSGITFDGEQLRNEWLTSAGGVSYARNSVEESNGIPQKIQHIFYNQSGDEINNSNGFSRVKYEYDDQGRLEKKKYYAMTEDGEEDTKVCTADCETLESGEKTVSVEIIDSEETAGKQLFDYEKVERTFEGRDSILPGALSSVRYYTGKSDSEAVREELHEYSRVDGEASEDEQEKYDYYIEENITVFMGKSAMESASSTESASEMSEDTAQGETQSEDSEDAAQGENQSEDSEDISQDEKINLEGVEGGAQGETQPEDSEDVSQDETNLEGVEGEAQDETQPEGNEGGAQDENMPEEKAGGDTDNAGRGAPVMTDRVTIRYFFVENDGQPELVRMGYYQDGSSVTGDAGFSYFTRSYSEDRTVKEDSFFGNEETEENGGETVPALLSGEDPLLTGSVMPGYYSVENPWMFRIP